MLPDPVSPGNNQVLSAGGKVRLRAQAPAKEMELTKTFLLRVRRKERSWCLEVGRYQEDS